MDPRSIDPNECWVRHVRRGAPGDPSAFALGRVTFVRDDVVSGRDGVNGRQGWQASQVTLALSDDGTYALTLPNTAGDDGVLHRRRFAVLTDPLYEPGEEWLEVWTSADPPDRPLIVVTPTDGGKNKSTVTITCRDVGAALDGVLTSDVDVWDANAPADVLRHYTRLPVLAYGSDLSASETGAAGAWSAGYTQALTGVATDSWEAEARLRWTSPRPAAAGAGAVRVTIAGLTFDVDVFEGAVTLTGAPERPVTGKRAGLTVPAVVSLRIVARYDRIFAFCAGELVADFRRPSPWPAVPTIAVYAFGGTVAIDGLHVETLAAFAARGPSAVIARTLPGIPPATGLRGQYWNAAPTYAQNATGDGRLARLWAMLTGTDPAVDRVDPTVAFPAGTAGYPPNMPGAYAARWSGAIYLDLAASDRDVRLSGLVGHARLYVGRTLRGDEGAAQWFGVAAGASATITLAGLRAWLGTSEAGWFPIVVEVAHSAAAGGVVLEDRVAAGAYATVPTTRLSPIGVYSDTVRLVTPRSVIGDVATTFGLQWRWQYRSVESGEFPAQLEAGAMIGRQTSLEIDDDAVGSDVEVQVAAQDVIDALSADGAGIADPAGSGQLTARVVDYARAGAHLGLRQAYESLSDISEAPLLLTRIGSLLALRGSPNEQVGVRPTGQRDLVEAFPLTGAPARMDWRPGDAVRLRLDSVDVVDLSPRQMTSIAWEPRPDGLGAPTVGWRQRPRSVKDAMRRLTRAIYGPRRNYQGQLAVTTGSIGGLTSAAAAVAGASDGYTRVSLPANLDDVVSATLVVQSISGAGWRMEIAGVDLGATDGAVSQAAGARYDVTRALKATTAGVPVTSARLIGGSSGSYLITLEVAVRV